MADHGSSGSHGESVQLIDHLLQDLFGPMGIATVDGAHGIMEGGIHGRLPFGELGDTIHVHDVPDALIVLAYDLHLFCILYKLASRFACFLSSLHFF